MPQRNARRLPEEDRSDGAISAQPDIDSARPCPWCGSHETQHTPRGFVGPSNNRDQYLKCHRCGRTTWEIVSRTTRDMRMGQFRAGDVWRDHSQQTRYVITRILRAGSNETLLYLRPVPRSIPTSDSRSGPP